MGGKAKSLTVIGAGVWGLASALACARRGWSVTVLEAAHVGAGASGGIVGAMAPHAPDQWNPKKQFQFEALDTADAYWAEVETLSGMASGYGRIGRVQPLVSAAARQLAHLRHDSASSLWQGRHGWRVIDRPDWLSPDVAPFGAIHDSLSGRIHPARATAALAAACRASGVTIAQGVSVRRLTQAGCATDAAEHPADATILAAGVGGFELLAPWVTRRPGAGQKGQAALLDADLRGRPQVYADGIYIVPHADGTVAVGSTSEGEYDSPTATDGQLETVIARARAICPALAAAPVLRRWAALRPRPRRRDPMLGPIPGLPRHFAALGAFKIGFGLAHKVGDTLADCLDGRADIPQSFTIDAHLA